MKQFPLFALCLLAPGLAAQAPDTQLDHTPPADTFVPNALFEFQAPGSTGASYQIKLDGSGWQPISDSYAVFS